MKFTYLDADGNQQTQTVDLRNDPFLPIYESFTIKKNSYTGNWFSERIDASTLNDQLIANGKGANINAGAGNDVIYGSQYSDTIKGGEGEDIIITNQTQYEGKNTIDGGNDSDKYYLFEDREFGANNIQCSVENTIIKDTGKEGIDSAYLNLSIDEMIDSRFWFNIDKKGNVSTTINIDAVDVVIDEGKNRATLTNIENIYIKEELTDNYYSWQYNKDNVIELIKTWLAGTSYKDINAVMSETGSLTDQKAVLDIFAQGWEEYIPS